MRMANAAGLDAPAIWKTGSTCVGTGGTFTVPINSGVALPNAVDDLKAAIFWYDRRHELGTVIDDIDLELHNVGGSTPLRSSASSWDNKERVYHNAIGGQAVELRIKGYDVTTDGEGCGTNQTSFCPQHGASWEAVARFIAHREARPSSPRGRAPWRARARGRARCAR